MKRIVLALAVALPLAVFAAEKAAPKAEPAKEQKAAPAKAEPAKEAPKAAEAPKAPATNERHVKVKVTEDGFVPAHIDAKVGEGLVLDVTRETEHTCATSILIPDQKLKMELPLNKEVLVPVKVEKTGTINFGCQMGLMIKGAVVVK